MACGILQAAETLPAMTHRRWSMACDDIAYWAGTYAPTHSLRVALALWYLLMHALDARLWCFAMLCCAVMLLSDAMLAASYLMYPALLRAWPSQFWPRFCLYGVTVCASLALLCSALLMRSVVVPSVVWHGSGLAATVGQVLPGPVFLSCCWGCCQVKWAVWLWEASLLLHSLPSQCGVLLCW